MYGLLFVTGGAAFCGGKAAPLFYVLFLYSIPEYESNSSAISDTPHIHNAKLSFVVVQDSPFSSVNAKSQPQMVLLAHNTAKSSHIFLQIPLSPCRKI